MYVRLTLLAEVVDPKTGVVVREDERGLQIGEEVELLAEEFLRDGRLHGGKEEEIDVPLRPRPSAA